MNAAPATPLPPLPDADQTLIDAWLDAQWLERGLSRHTLESYGRDLRQFGQWLAARGGGLARCQRLDVLEYLADRVGVSARSVARQLSAMKSFFRWMKREGRLQEDPTLNVDRPRTGRPLPKTLSEADVEALLAAPDLDDALGLRDRAMLEVLYACGLRVSELVGLTLSQVNPARAWCGWWARATRSVWCPWARRPCTGWNAICATAARPCSALTGRCCSQAVAARA